MLGLSPTCTVSEGLYEGFMIIEDPVKVHKLERARQNPCLPMLSFDINSVHADAVRIHFPSLDIPVNLYFVEIATLACVLKKDIGADIFIHVILNDYCTPIQVCNHIILHELLHLIVPPEIIEGKEVSHTPMFWQQERQMIPDRSTSWGWIWTNFSMCLRKDVKAECIHVRRNWKKYANMPRCSWEHCKTLQASFASEKVTL